MNSLSPRRHSGIIGHRAALAWLAGLFTLVVVFGALRWRFIVLPLFGDELGWYVSFPLQVYDSVHWLRLLLLGIVGSSPGMPVVLVVYWKLAGYSLLATKLLFFLLATTTVVITAAVRRKLGGSSVGMGAASLLALSPPFFFHPGFGTTEVFVTLLAASSLLLGALNT
jgi:4-amino-4-deoxy-L-arabinose transferase-like glycosyltransferase